MMNEVQALSILALRWRDRPVGRMQTPRRFLDFVVDGHSLFDLLRQQDTTTPLVAGFPDWSAGVIEELLLQRHTELDEERQALYVCAECGDIGCGATTAVVVRQGDRIVWKDFAYYNPYGNFVTNPATGQDDVSVLIRRDGLEAIGPFIFDATAYSHVLLTGLQSLRDHSGGDPGNQGPVDREQP